MRHVDLKGLKPSQRWLDKSDALTRRLIELHDAGDIAGRNALIKNNEKHWGELKKWLLDRSYNKCWFSEARDKYSHMDVEHFRPKTEAKSLDGVKRDGYWWLAFDYRNLRACGNVGNRKKGGFFPLQAGSIISTHLKQCEESETPYLLDPTDEDDVALLAFDEEGKAISAPNCSAWETERVTETVKRMKLNEHETLTEERRKLWQEVTREIENYYRAKVRCAAGGNPAARQRAVDHARNIRKMTRKQAELSSVAVWCVLFRNDSRLARLVA